MKEIKNFIGVGCLLERNGEFLLVKQGFGEMINKWVLPGGHLENGESLSIAAKRELYEETGLHGETCGIAAIRTKQINSSITDVYIVFVVNEFDSCAKPTWDGSEILEAAFFSIEAMKDDENVAWLATQICTQYLENDRTVKLTPKGIDTLPYNPFGFYELYL